MRFKADENLPREVTGLLRRKGHDAISVVEQRLGGHSDTDIAAVCQVERRAIVTQDLDFSDIRAFPPPDYCGIIVLRPRLRTVSTLLRLMNRAIAMFDDQPLIGQLWIVDEHRVRIWSGS